MAYGVGLVFDPETDMYIREVWGRLASQGFTTPLARPGCLPHVSLILSETVRVDDLAAGKYPMPQDCSGSDDVFIGRLREDLSSDHGLAFWCVSDNLRKGAATNAVQIAELLVRSKAAV